MNSKKLQDKSNKLKGENAKPLLSPLNFKLSTRLRSVAVFAVLAVVIMGPMLLPGYILTLDMIFTPTIAAPESINNTLVFEWLMHLLNFVLPSQLLQKLLILGILVLCGYGMHRLVSSSFTTKKAIVKKGYTLRSVSVRAGSAERVVQRSYHEASTGRFKPKMPKKPIHNEAGVWPLYFAGILYIANPFTYERWLAGQYYVLLGYALLPFFLKSLFNFCTKPSIKNALWAAGWLCLIGAVSIHIFVISFIVAAVCLSVYVVKKSKDKTYSKNLALGSLVALIAVLIVNSYWFIATLNGSSTTAQTIDGIGGADINAFATSGTGFGLFFNVLSMYGFWLGDDGRYAAPNSNKIIWIVGFALIFSLVVIGARLLHKRRSLPGRVLFVCAIIGFIFALGVNAPLIGNLTRMIIEHVPFMSGFRDSQKFSVLIVLAYAYFAAHGLNYVLKKLKNLSPLKLELLRSLALLLPILYVPTMLLGFSGQLKPVDYPDSWYSFNETLKNDNVERKILFLPWHQYMSYDFTPRVIANPAPRFFTNAEVVSSSNAELGGIKAGQSNPDGDYVEKNVLTRTSSTNLGEQLAQIQVEYILLSGGYDAEQYGYLEKQQDLELVSPEPGLSVYKNRAYFR